MNEALESSAVTSCGSGTTRVMYAERPLLADELALLAGLRALDAALARDLELARREEAGRDVLAVDAGQVRDHEHLVLVLAHVHAELAADRRQQPVADAARSETAAEPVLHLGHQLVKLSPNVVSVCHRFTPDGRGPPRLSTGQPERIRTFRRDNTFLLPPDRSFCRLMITLALAGKPNCGKSTFFKAATLADAEIANYPFTTIDANHGVAYVRVPCPCTTLALPGGAATCGHCTDGVRFIPINLIDVAGLVPEAHTGRGLGNQFLDHLRQADAIIHVVDGSGATDAEGNPVGVGEHDPESDIAFLPLEMTMWIQGILAKHWAKLLRQAQGKAPVLHASRSPRCSRGSRSRPRTWPPRSGRPGSTSSTADEAGLVAFCGALLRRSKPMIAVANKADQAPDALLERLREHGVPPATAAGELALRNAAKAGLVTYLPGDPSFAVADRAGLSKAQAAGLDALAAVMARLGGTGVQPALNRAVFEPARPDRGLPGRGRDPLHGRARPDPPGRVPAADGRDPARPRVRGPHRDRQGLPLRDRRPDPHADPRHPAPQGRRHHPDRLGRKISNAEYCYSRKSQ